MTTNNKNKEIAAFDLCSNLSLLDQMDRKLSSETMIKAAKEAYDLLEDFTRRSVEKQVELVSNMTVRTLHRLDKSKRDSISASVATASVLMASRTGRMTANEKISMAMQMLGDRYQADW